jgi:hypothetical protein
MKTIANGNYLISSLFLNKYFLLLKKDEKEKYTLLLCEGEYIFAEKQNISIHDIESSAEKLLWRIKYFVKFKSLPLWVKEEIERLPMEEGTPVESFQKQNVISLTFNN